VVSLRTIYQSNREFFFLSLVWAPDQVINYWEVPLSDFWATYQCRRGPRILPPLWPTELIGSVKGKTFSVRLNRSGCESDTLPQSSNEVKNACSYASTSPLVFMTSWTEQRLCVFPPYNLPLHPLLKYWLFFFRSGTRTTIVRTSYGETKIFLLGIFVASFWLWLTFSARATARPAPSISAESLNFVLWKM